MSGWSLSDGPFIIIVLALVVYALEVVIPWLWFSWSYKCFTSQAKAMAKLVKLIAKAEQSVRLFGNGFHVNTDDDTHEAYQRLIQEIRVAANRGVEIIIKTHDEPPASLQTLAGEGLITIERSA